MTYEQLIQLQGWATVVFLLCLVVGAIHLLAGLIKPAWVRRAGRGGVLLVTCGLWLAGLLVWGGTIGYTHSHPEGPHSLHRYLDSYFAEQCAQGADIPACRKDGAAPSADQPATPTP